MKHRIGRNTVLGLSLIALAAAVFQVGNSWLTPGKAEAQTGNQRFAFFAASQVFGLAQRQRARFCVGTVNSQGPELDWTVRISDERGNLLLQLPETHSPSGEWRCVDVPRSSLNVAGEPGTGRDQIAASEVVKAPFGTRSSDFIGSFELVNDDGSTTAGAAAAILWAAVHNN